MNFWRIVEILNKRKWLILLSVVASIGLTFLVTRLIGYKWVGTVRLVSTAPMDQQPGSDGMRDQMNSKFQAPVYDAMLKSRDVLEAAFRVAKVVDVPENFLQNIQISSAGPRLFELLVTDTNPTRAEALANALADAFVTKNSELYTKKAGDAVTIIKTQLDEVDEKITVTRDKYDRYRQSKGIVTHVESHVGPALMRVQLDRQKREQIAEQLADATARLHAQRASLGKLQPRVKDEITTQDSPLVRNLRERLAAVDTEIAELTARYKDEKIEVRQAKARRDELQRKLDAETAAPSTVAWKANPERAPLEASVKELEQEIVSYRAQLSQVEQALISAQTELETYKGVDGPLMAMIGELNQLTEMRIALNGRLQAAEAAKDIALRQDPVQVLDKVGPFNPPVNATAGRTVKLVILAALCALVGTSGLLVALDNVDRRLRSVKQAEQVLPAPVLAAIPQPLGVVTSSNLARATELHPQSLHSEAYHFLGLHLLSGSRRRIRSLMVLTAKAEQGSASTVSNLGITLAQAGQQVIIVDANVRSGQIHEIFGMSNDLGFSDLLRNPDLSSLESALQPTTVPGLRVITSGPASANPWELFRSQNLIEISHRLRDLADYVIYDTPSALAFTDALNLAPVVDAAYLCVRALESPTGAEERLCALLREENVEIIGAVLNDVPASVLDSYQHYNNYYPTIVGEAPAVVGDGDHEPVAAGSGPSWVQLPHSSEGRSDED